MLTNIFFNPYKQAENQLMYRFLTIIELTNNKALCEFLTKRKLQEKPVSRIRTGFGGGLTYPNCSFDLKEISGETFTVYFENDAKILGLTHTRIIEYLDSLSVNDLILIITPGKSEFKNLYSINYPRILFYSWSEVIVELKKMDEIICEQFIISGKKSKAFDKPEEITNQEINTFCDYYKSDFDKKIMNIILNFYEQVDISKYNLNIPKKLNDDWGRRGVQFIKEIPAYVKNRGISYGQFFEIAYYYKTEDHEIPFKINEPELCVFFDVHPSKKDLLKSDSEFRTYLNDLIPLGFESNLDEEITGNAWRLFFYRKPLSEFKKLSVETLSQFTNEVFEYISNSSIIHHKYFEELKKYDTSNYYN